MRTSILFTVAFALLFSSQVASAFPFGKGVLGTDIFGDSDQDLVSAAQEAIDGTNPIVADTDGDGLTDGQEASNGTNPLLSDTYGDDYSDLDEINSNSDLLGANSIRSKGLPIWLIKAAKDKMEQDASN